MKKVILMVLLAGFTAMAQAFTYTWNDGGFRDGAGNKVNPAAWIGQDVKFVFSLKFSEYPASDTAAEYLRLTASDGTNWRLTLTQAGLATWAPYAPGEAYAHAYTMVSGQFSEERVKEGFDLALIFKYDETSGNYRFRFGLPAAWDSTQTAENGFFEAGNSDLDTIAPTDTMFDIVDISLAQGAALTGQVKALPEPTALALLAFGAAALALRRRTA